MSLHFTHHEIVLAEIGVVTAAVGAVVGAVVTVTFGGWVERRRQIPMMQRVSLRVGLLGALAGGILGHLVAEGRVFDSYWFFSVAFFAWAGFFGGCVLGGEWYGRRIVRRSRR